MSYRPFWWKEERRETYAGAVRCRLLRTWRHRHVKLAPFKGWIRYLHSFSVDFISISNSLATSSQQLSIQTSYTKSCRFKFIYWFNPLLLAPIHQVINFSVLFVFETQNEYETCLNLSYWKINVFGDCTRGFCS